MSIYELAILGDAAPDERATLTATIRDMVGEFGLTLDDDVIVHDGESIPGRDKRVAFAAVYFGGSEYSDIETVRDLVDSNAPVIPTVGTGQSFQTAIPSILHYANGLRRRVQDSEMSELASALLECVGLLRTQRRVFVSYRRTEAREAAVQLHDLLSGRGFDVFLDTHSIRPGEPFQEVLWHRLVDSDVVVMLDTPS